MLCLGKLKALFKFSLHLTRASCFQSRSQIRLHRVKNIKYVYWIPNSRQTRNSNTVSESCRQFAPDQVHTLPYITYRFIQLQLIYFSVLFTQWISIFNSLGYFVYLGPKLLFWGVLKLLLKPSKLFATLIVFTSVITFSLSSHYKIF